MKDIVGITGGSGFVGRHLTDLLIREGYEVIIFSRGKKAGKGPVTYAHWDPAKKECDTGALARVNAVVNLAGAGVADKRWTAARKVEILNSRVDATHFLLAQLAASAPQCRTFISASATGYYGPDRPGTIPFRETAPPYHDFLAEVCRQWEAAAGQAAARYRTAIFRFGIVLGRDGGAYPQLAQPFSLGVMPILGGKGDQVVSWVHVADVAGMVRAALEGEAYQGSYNAVAPHPVTHLQLMQAIGKAKGGGRIPVPVPAFALRIIMGESSIEVLKSCTASADKVQAAGYSFQFPTIDGAIADLTAT